MTKPTDEECRKWMGIVQQSGRTSLTLTLLAGKATLKSRGKVLLEMPRAEYTALTANEILAMIGAPK